MTNWQEHNRREFEKVYNNFENIKKELPDFLIQFLKDQANSILRNTIKRSPVITGNLRSHWDITDVEVSNGNFIIYLINPVKYTSFVEYGTRNSLGRFMATVSIKEAEAKMPERFKKRFQNWLKENGIW